MTHSRLLAVLGWSGDTAFKKGTTAFDRSTGSLGLTEITLGVVGVLAIIPCGNSIDAPRCEGGLLLTEEFLEGALIVIRQLIAGVLEQLLELRATLRASEPVGRASVVCRPTVKAA